MTDREKLARQWAESRQQFDNRSERERAAADYILDNIEPQTPPTMADVEWDDEKHAGLGVQVPNGNNRVLISMDTPSLWLTALPDFTDFLLFPRGSLTPNRKRYELREVGKGEPDVRRAIALVGELARDHNLHSLTDYKLARTMNEVLDALADEKPDHPEVLTTLEDYKNASEGTIVSNGGMRIWAKRSSNDWITVRTAHARLDGHMANIERHILRWGDGA